MEGEKIDCKFKTFDEAMDLHKKLFEILNADKVVTYADLYYLINKTYRDCPIVYYSCGWTSLMESKVRPCEDGRKWGVVLPNPVDLTLECFDFSPLTKASSEITWAMLHLRNGNTEDCYKLLKSALMHLKEEKENK